jgi:hypothetical protein
VRILTRVVSALLALLLLVGGLAAAVEIMVAGIGREEPLWLPWDEWRRTALDTPWRDPATRIVFIVLLLVGLGLLALLLAPRRPRGIALAPRVDGADADLDRAGLEQWLASRLARVDGVDGVGVRIRRGRARVAASTPTRETAGVGTRLTAAAVAALGELGLASSLPVRVSVASARHP